MKAIFHNETTQSIRRLKGSEAVIDALISEGSHYIFGYPGGAIMPIYDALYSRKDTIHHILSRHEQGSIHAAQGYARVSGNVGVVFATSGPGATNLITGLADAMMDSTPLVCITGQVDQSLLGTDAFQETDVIGVSTAVTKWNRQVTDAQDIPEVLATAFHIARTGRPGPVLVDITKNAQFGMLDYEYKKCKSVRSYQPTESPSMHQVISEAARLINQAKKPLILFGQGVTLSGSESELVAFLEKSNIPAASTLLGLSAIPYDMSQYVGMLGMHGNYAPNKLSNKADVVLAIGMRFDDRVTGNLKGYLPDAKVIHMEIDPSEIGKMVYAHVPILGSVKKTLPLLTESIEPKDRSEWLQEFKTLYKKEYEKVTHDELYPSSGVITMGEVIRIINEKTKGSAVIVTDVGQHQMVACRYYQFKNRRSNVTSGGLGTMGFCVPAAIGAKLAAPDREVIAVVGDGGFQMTCQELGTIAQFGLAVKILILNNEFLGMVRQWQQLFFDKRYSFVQMENPDFIKLGGAYGIEGATIKKREALEHAVDVFLAHKSAYILEVRVGKENNVFPMIPTGANVDEITLESSEIKKFIRG